MATPRRPLGRTPEAEAPCDVPDVVVRYLQHLASVGGPPLGYGLTMYCARAPADRAELERQASSWDTLQRRGIIRKPQKPIAPLPRRRVVPLTDEQLAERAALQARQDEARAAVGRAEAELLEAFGELDQRMGFHKAFIDSAAGRRMVGRTEDGSRVTDANGQRVWPYFKDANGRICGWHFECLADALERDAVRNARGLKMRLQTALLHLVAATRAAAGVGAYPVSILGRGNVLAVILRTGLSDLYWAYREAVIPAGPGEAEARQRLAQQRAGNPDQMTGSTSWERQEALRDTADARDERVPVTDIALSTSNEALQLQQQQDDEAAASTTWLLLIAGGLVAVVVVFLPDIKRALKL